MPTALITGLLGQDGSLLAERLLDRDYRVVGVVRPGHIPQDPALRALADRCELVEVDLAHPADVWATELVARIAPDEVYHLAACHRSSEPRPGIDFAEQQRMVDVNLSAALALAHAVLQRGRGSLVLAGSSQMYTPAIPAASINETTPHAPASFYGVTKASARGAIGWLRANQGLRGSCAILFNHESSRRSVAFASRKITRAAVRIAAGLETSLDLIDVWSTVDLSSAHDVVAALHAIGAAPAPADYVVASGELHTLAELCEVAFAAVGLDWQEHVRSQNAVGPRPALRGDTSEIRRNLGWSPALSFEAWVQQMVEADRRALADRT